MLTSTTLCSMQRRNLLLAIKWDSRRSYWVILLRVPSLQSSLLVSPPSLNGCPENVKPPFHTSHSLTTPHPRPPQRTPVYSSLLDASHLHRIFYTSKPPSVGHHHRKFPSSAMIFNIARSPRLRLALRIALAQLGPHVLLRVSCTLSWKKTGKIENARKQYYEQIKLSREQKQSAHALMKVPKHRMKLEISLVARLEVR